MPPWNGLIEIRQSSVRFLTKLQEPLRTKRMSKTLSITPQGALGA